MFRFTRLTAALLAAFLTAIALAGCGGGTSGMTGLPSGNLPPVADGTTGSLRVTIHAADLGLAGRSRGGEPDPLVVHLWVQGPEQSESYGPQTKELADEVTFDVTGLRPARWHILILIRRGWLMDSPMVGRGMAEADVEAGRITPLFVPMELVATPPTTGGLAVSTATIVSVADGTEVDRFSTFEVTVAAPAAWIGEGVDRRAMVDFYQSDRPGGDGIRSWDNSLTLVDFVPGVSGETEPDVYWAGSTAEIPQTVYLRAGERITYRWRLSPPPYVTNLILNVQVGTKGINQWGNPSFAAEASDGHIHAEYPLVLGHTPPTPGSPPAGELDQSHARLVIESSTGVMFNGELRTYRFADERPVGNPTYPINGSSPWATALDNLDGCTRIRLQIVNLDNGVTLYDHELLWSELAGQELVLRDLT